MGGRSCSRVHSSLWQVEHLLVHLLFNLSTPCLIRTIFQSAFHSAISCIFVGWLLEWFQFLHQGVFLFGWFFLQFSSCALSCSQVGAQCYQWWSSLKRETLCKRCKTHSLTLSQCSCQYSSKRKRMCKEQCKTLSCLQAPLLTIYTWGAAATSVASLGDNNQPYMTTTNQPTIYGQSYNARNQMYV